MRDRTTTVRSAAAVLALFAPAPVCLAGIRSEGTNTEHSAASQLLRRLAMQELGVRSAAGSIETTSAAVIQPEDLAGAMAPLPAPDAAWLGAALGPAEGPGVTALQLSGTTPTVLATSGVSIDLGDLSWSWDLDADPGAAMPADGSLWGGADASAGGGGFGGYTPVGAGAGFSRSGLPAWRSGAGGPIELVPLPPPLALGLAGLAGVWFLRRRSAAG